MALLYKVGNFICTFILLLKLVDGTFLSILSPDNIFVMLGNFFYDVIKGPDMSKKGHWLKYIEINRVWAQIKSNEKWKSSVSFCRWWRHQWRHNRPYRVKMYLSSHYFSTLLKHAVLGFIWTITIKKLFMIIFEVITSFVTS